MDYRPKLAVESGSQENDRLFGDIAAGAGHSLV
jgi:hypothetical protein